MDIKNHIEEEDHLLQPPSKKPKMSSTSTDDDETTTKPRRYKRRKVAIFFAYCGVGYQGMQKNPGAKTIEGDFEEALYQAGAVPEHDRGQPKRFDWARSARTDKGVSAVGQVVSGRFYVDPPGFVQRLNSHLVSQIRVFGFKRVVGSFNAKKFCDRRRYVYLIPVFALDPSCHRDRESVLASLGSGDELVKCVVCSERGRKVAGLMGNKRVFEGVANMGGNEVEVDDLSKNGNGNGNANETALLSAEGNGEDGCGDGDEKSEFKYDDEVRERFNRILRYYEGTHNFHNFTTRTKAEDPAAKRYIVSFQANTTLTVEGIEFVKCEVIGQSFMLHQIRKMMGMAVAIMRNFASESIFERAFQQDVHINVPTAPEVGLYLDECFFTSYNKKWQDSHEEVSMKDYAEEAEEFKLKNIYTHIANTEHKEGAVALWLHSLNYRNYSGLRPVVSDEQVNAEEKSSEVEALAEVDTMVVSEVEKSGEEDTVVVSEAEKVGEVDTMVVCEVEKVSEVDTNILSEAEKSGEVDTMVVSEAEKVGEADTMVVSEPETLGEADTMVVSEAEKLGEVDTTVVSA